MEMLVAFQSLVLMFGMDCIWTETISDWWFGTDSPVIVVLSVNDIFEKKEKKKRVRVLFENWCAFFDKSPFNIQSPRLGLEQCAPRTPYPSHDSNPLPQTPKAFGRFTFPSRPRYFFPPKQFGRFSVESGIIHFPISFSNTSFICSPFNPPIQIPRIPPRRTSRYHRSFQNFSPSKTTWRDILRPPPHASGSKSKHIRIRFRF